MGLKRKIHKFFIEHIVIFSPLLYFIYKHIQSTRIFFDIKSCLNLSSYKKLSHVCLINKNGEPTNIEHRLTFCFLTFEFFLNSNYKRCNEHHSLRNLFNMKLWWFFISWTLLITLTYTFLVLVFLFFLLVISFLVNETWKKMFLFIHWWKTIERKSSWKDKYTCEGNVSSYLNNSFSLHGFSKT